MRQSAVRDPQGCLRYTPLRTASVTEAPNPAEPTSSKMAAIIIAVFRLRDLDPTEVPKLFETSLAPMPNPSVKQKIAPRITALGKISYPV